MENEEIYATWNTKEKMFNMSRLDFYDLFYKCHSMSSHRYEFFCLLEQEYINFMGIESQSLNVVTYQGCNEFGKRYRISESWAEFMRFNYMKYFHKVRKFYNLQPLPHVHPNDDCDIYIF